MGLYINAYGIKLDEVNAILGSKDGALYQRIVESKVFNVDVDKPDFGSEIPVSKALKDLVYDSRDAIKADTAYVAALYYICMYVRKDLPHCLDIKSGIETNQINYYLAKDFKLRNFDIEVLLADPFRIFNLPDMYNELDIEPYECPVVGLLTLNNLRYLKRRFRNIKITDETVTGLIKRGSGDPHPATVTDEQVKGYEYQNIKWIIEDINYCIDNRLDMFTTLG
jgi:hypothetical protein